MGISCTNRDTGYGHSSWNTEIHGLDRMTGNVLTPFLKIHISIYLCIFEFAYCQEPLVASQTHNCTEMWIPYNDDSFKTKNKTMELHHCGAFQLPFTNQPGYAYIHRAEWYMIEPIFLFFGYGLIRTRPLQ